MRLRNTVLIIGGLLALLLLIPWLIPTASYIQQAERIASEKLGQPVTIGGLKPALLPTPRINVRDVTIGKEQELSVKSVAVILDIASLFAAQKVLSSVEIEHLMVKQSSMGLLSAMPPSSGPPAVIVRKVNVRDLQVVLESQPKLPSMDASVVLDETNKPVSAKLVSSDDKLHIDAVPGAAGIDVAMNAKQWVVPVGMPVKFDSLAAKMVLQGSQLSVSSLEASLYHGTLSAKGMADWSKALRLEGQFETKNIEVTEASQLFSKKPLLSGRLNGHGTLKTDPHIKAALIDQLSASYTFNIEQGVLHGVDLAKAATLLLRDSEQSGETQFDELKGVVHVAGKQIELKPLSIVSGLLSANGGVKVSPTKQLSGEIEVELKKGVAMVSVPLEISGPVEDPSVQPTKAAMAGAAVGTGMLGPGVGTALGVKAATGMEKLKGLFGGEK